MGRQSRHGAGDAHSDNRQHIVGVQSLKIGAIAQILPLIANYGTNLLATPYVVIQLGLHDFGVWSITGAIAQYAALFDLGVSRAVNRYVALFHARGDADKDRAVVGICLTAIVGLGTVLVATAALIAGAAENLLRTGDVALTRFLLLCAAVMLICGLLARALAAASFGRGRQVPANIGLAVLGVAQVICGVVALGFAPTLRHFAFGTAVGSVVGLCAVVVAIVVDEGRITIGRPGAALAREIMAFGMKGQALGAADVVLFQSGKLIAGIVIGPVAAGAYELGIRLIQGVQAIGAAASVAITTHLTRAYATGGIRAITSQYSRLTRQNAAAAIFLPALLGTTAFSAVPLWLGDQQGKVVTVVAALAPGIAVNLSAAVCAATVLALGRSGIIGATAVAVATMSVALAIPLAVAFGFNGLVAAYACWFIVGNLLGVWFLQSRIGIPMMHFLDAIYRPFAVALLASMAAAPINLIAPPHDRASAIAPFLATSGTFCAVYIALGWRLGYLPRLWGSIRRHQTPAPPIRHDASANRVADYPGIAAKCVGSVAIIGTRGYPSFYGGFETLVRKLAPFLADDGWKVTVYSRPGATIDAIEYHHSGIKSVTTKGFESKSLSTLTFGATSTLDTARRKPDVALVMNVANGYWLPLLRARGIPSVVNVDGIEWQRGKWNQLGKSVFKAGANMTSWFADVIICDSVEIGRYWRDNFKRSGVFIPYGGDVPDGPHKLLAGLEERKYVLQVARLVPENTVAEFLDAAEELIEDYPVVIVGSPGYRTAFELRLQALSEMYDKFIWLGHVSNDRMLASLWQNCGAYFHGHSVGGTNPALVQAMACGAPTIARDTVFNREVLLDSGLFVPPDAAQISAAVRELINNPALQNSLGRRAQERARTVFSWQSICAAYERVLCAAMDGRPAAAGRRHIAGQAGRQHVITATGSELPRIYEGGVLP